VNREQFERIANDEVDGIATPEEREALRLHLAGNPDARESYRALVEMVGTLNQVGLEVPPPDLKPNVLRAAASRAKASAPVTGDGFWRSLFAGAFRAGVFQTVPWREAVPFAAGVGVGVLAIVLFSGNLVGSSRDNLANLRGTMMPRDTQRGAVQAARQVVAAGEARVTVTTWSSGPDVTLQVAVVPGPADDAAVEITGTGLQISDLRIVPPGAGVATVGPTGIRIGQRASGGVGEYVVQLRGEEAHPALLEIQVRSGGQSARTEVLAGSSGPVK